MGDKKDTKKQEQNFLKDLSKRFSLLDDEHKQLTVDWESLKLDYDKSPDDKKKQKLIDFSKLLPKLTDTANDNFMKDYEKMLKLYKDLDPKKQNEIYNNALKRLTILKYKSLYLKWGLKPKGGKPIPKLEGGIKLEF